MSKENKKRKLKVNQAIFLSVELDTSQLRKETVSSVNYLIAPIVMFTEGVRNGILYLYQELSNSIRSFSGIPVTINHPHINNEKVSANDLAVLNTFGIGRLFNVQAEETRISGEVYFNIEETKEKAPGFIEDLEAGKPCEISSGVFTDLDEWPGTFNTEPYEAVAYNIIADHIAILPNSEGACNLDDGCGIRTNSKQESSNFVNAESDINSLIEELKNNPLPTHKKSRLSTLVNNIKDYFNKQSTSTKEEEMDLKTIQEFLTNSANADIKRELFVNMGVCPEMKKEQQEVILNNKVAIEPKTDVPFTLQESLDSIADVSVKTKVTEFLANEVTVRDDLIKTLSNHFKAEDLKTYSNDTLNTLSKNIQTNDFSGNVALKGDQAYTRKVEMNM